MNDLIWKGTQTTPREVFLRVEEWLASYHQCHKVRKEPRTNSLQSWNAPPPTWVKCNFDGAWVKSAQKGRVGVVFRNQEGEFMAGLSVQIAHVASPLQVELLVARRALLFANELILDGGLVCFEEDSAIVLAAIKRQEEDVSTMGPIINDIRRLLLSFPKVRAFHVQREAN
ncbi:uncharacterized protein LOC125472935 [Pyrus x bretschneideri]|uniref:uncharacterized protein LOC125472935 n=1 Tax=Pyrus x bretschneideri TaxID=225117 RepID=UPI00203010FF|nr:uncharacterized protein LOC125472935 [Pyrus x bretschneideri]